MTSDEKRFCTIVFRTPDSVLMGGGWRPVSIVVEK